MMVSTDTIRTVSTFESMSIYHSSSYKGDCSVYYRIAGSNTWSESLPLWYSKTDMEYRGSLFHLLPGNRYDIRLQFEDGSQHDMQSVTRSDTFPVGKITELPAGTLHETVFINESGTAGAYHLVSPPAGKKTVLDMMNTQQHCIQVNASYVIIQGIDLRNAAEDGIYIPEDRQDVVIQNCRISKWGRLGGALSYGNQEGNRDSGIFVRDNSKRITIQRNLIENPRGITNDWREGHPRGPQAISFIDSQGQNVIRYNELWSSEDHAYNDIIGGSYNFSYNGNMNQDSDIYGNILRNCWDDAIECEGANKNVRIWGNYLEDYFVGIGASGTSSGPLYVFRNILGRSRKFPGSSLGGTFLKTSGGQDFQDGRKYIFHNTLLQPRGVYHVFSGSGAKNITTANNIFDCSGRLLTSKYRAHPANELQHDLFTGKDASEYKKYSNMICNEGSQLSYLADSNYTLQHYPSTLLSGTDQVRKIPETPVAYPGKDSGLYLPGINSEYTGAAPDIGAFERGIPPLEFGRRAYLPPEHPRDPWE